MRQALKIFGYTLGAAGAFFILAAFVPSEEGTPEEIAQEETMSCLILGIPALLAGGGLVWSNSNQQTASANEIKDTEYD